MNQKEKFCKEDGAEKVDEMLHRSLIGCLMYLSATRPDILHAVSLLSTDWAGCVDDMRSTWGYHFSFNLVLEYFHGIQKTGSDCS
ncbi:unnamed protein product [Trifolium pratense]|uniref:Uncharacterized protein n=1 Tax=Trifolium pratense TaxID=57577 RepID=A0ACB0JQ62_TRIPR|nr:unnamed protein product [Trifolium pratense]